MLAKINKDLSLQLFDAVKNDDARQVRHLLHQDGIDVNKVDCNENTPLIQAVRYGSENAVKLLLDYHKTDVNWQCNAGKTALMFAKICGRRNIFNMILAHPKTNVNMQDQNQNTVLINSCQVLSVELVEDILTRTDVDLHIRNRHGKTAYDYVKDENSDKAKLICQALNNYPSYQKMMKQKGEIMALSPDEIRANYKNMITSFENAYGLKALFLGLNCAGQKVLIKMYESKLKEKTPENQLINEIITLQFNMEKDKKRVNTAFQNFLQLDNIIDKMFINNFVGYLKLGAGFNLVDDKYIRIFNAVPYNMQQIMAHARGLDINAVDAKGDNALSKAIEAQNVALCDVCAYHPKLQVDNKAFYFKKLLHMPQSLDVIKACWPLAVGEDEMIQRVIHDYKMTANWSLNKSAVDLMDEKLKEMDKQKAVLIAKSTPRIKTQAELENEPF